jgi:hypothetical protein
MASKNRQLKNRINNSPTTKICAELSAVGLSKSHTAICMQKKIMQQKAKEREIQID